MTLTEIEIILGTKVKIKPNGIWFFAKLRDTKFPPMAKGLTVRQQMDYREEPCGCGFSEKAARKKLAKDLRGKIVFVDGKSVTMPPKINHK